MLFLILKMTTLTLASSPINFFSSLRFLFRDFYSSFLPFLLFLFPSFLRVRPGAVQTKTSPTSQILFFGKDRVWFRVFFFQISWRWSNWSDKQFVCFFVSINTVCFIRRWLEAVTPFDFWRLLIFSWVVKMCFYNHDK